MSYLDTYVYIMGRGHSGSTVLDSLLDNVKGLQGTGEMVVGLPRLDSMGKQSPEASDVQFWRTVKRDFSEHFSEEDWQKGIQAQYDQAKVWNCLRVLLMKESSSEVNLLRSSILRIANSVARVGGAHCVIDSSKEIARGFFIARFIPNARVIHLVRHPERVIASTLHRMRHMHGFRIMRRNIQLPWVEPFFVAVAILAWNVGNALCELVKREHPDKVITVRYEDLCRNYETELDRIGEHIGEDLSILVEKIRSGTPLHTGLKIAGNQIIEKETFVFRTKESSRHIPVFYSKLCRSISHVMMKLYEYK